MRKWTGALLLFLLLACATGCDDVKVDYDTAADFSAYKTYAWKAIDPQDKRQLEYDYPESAKRLKAAINRELMNQGLQSKENGEADLIVSYQVVLGLEFAGRSTNAATAGEVAVAPIWSAGTVGGGVAYQEPIKEGTLIIRLDDRRQGKPVWQGQLSRKFRNPSDLKPADIRKSIGRLFSKFPR